MSIPEPDDEKPLPPEQQKIVARVRWLMLIPAGPGALLGGYVGEHFGLRYTLIGAGGFSLLLAAWAWRYSILSGVAVLPTPASTDDISPVDAAAESGLSTAQSLQRREAVLRETPVPPPLN